MTQFDPTFQVLFESKKRVRLMYPQTSVVHQNIIFLMPKKQKTSTTSSMLNVTTTKNVFLNT